MSPEKELKEQLTLIMLANEGVIDPSELDGFNEYDEYELGIHKKLRKGLKRYTKSIKNVVKNPGKAIERKVKRSVKLVKKVAPYAAAGAAIYFAAPYAMAGAKYLMGGRAAMAMAQGGGPMPEGQMGPPAPATSFVSPEVLKMGGQIAIRELARRGMKVRSPQAQQAVEQYVANEAYRAERAVVPGGGFDMKKWLIPAAVAGTVAIIKFT